MDICTKIKLRIESSNLYTAREHIDLAIKLLELGIESDAILILAGLGYSEDKLEVKDWFYKVFDDIVEPLKLDKKSIIEYAQNIAHKILVNEMQANDGLEKLANFKVYCHINAIQIPSGDYILDYDEIWDGSMPTENIDDLIKKEVFLFLESLE